MVRAALMLAALCSLAPPPGRAQEPPPGARQAWIQMDRDLRTQMGRALRRYLPTLMREVYRQDVSSGCLGALLHLTNALKQGKLWPYQMLDASGKFPEGFLSGTLTALGNYEECLGIRLDSGKVRMRGQYCLLHLQPPIPPWRPYTSLHLAVPELRNISEPDTLVRYLTGFIHNTHVTTVKNGLCVPDRCSRDDVHRLAQIVPEVTGLPWKFTVESCEGRQATEFTASQLAALGVLGLVCLLVVVGSVVDVDSENRALALLRCFSFAGGGRRLAAYRSPRAELTFVHGLVFFAFIWIVIANTFMYVNYDIASNFVEALSLVKSLFYEMVLNRIFPLQALLYLSGFVTAYSCLKNPEPTFNVPKFLLKRYLRYTPTYALLIALMLLTPSFGSGPTWTKSVWPLHDNCRDHWWRNLLFINNFQDTTEACLDHTWLFAVDAQLHLIAVFILMPLKMRPAVGLMLNAALGLASLVSVALTNVYYDLPPNEMAAFLHQKDRNTYAEHSYYRVYTHISVYCTGIAVAYMMVKKPDWKISRKTSWFLWLSTGTGYLGALCAVHEWRSGPMPSPLIGALYASFSKVAECAFLAWTTVAFMTGHGGGARSVLGWRPFAFFGRLTFVAFLIHVPLITVVNAFKKTHVFVLEFEIFYLVLSYLAATFIMSYVLHVFLEAPFLSLADVVRRRAGMRVLTEKPPKASSTKGRC